MTQRLEDFLDALQGFRKFIVMLILVIIGVALLLTKFITGSDFVNLLSGVGTAFMASNAVEHVGEVIRDHIASKNGPSDT